MSEKILNFWRGVGSLLDIFPQPRTFRIGKDILDGSAGDALHGDMQRIGGDFLRAQRKVLMELLPNGEDNQKAAECDSR